MSFSSSQISEMQSDLNSAHALIEGGTSADLMSAIGFLGSYYQVQFGFNGYSELAYQVVNNKNVFGMTANQVLSYDNITYGSSSSVQLIFNLASDNNARTVCGRIMIPLGTLRDWEPERAEPDATARAYLRAIAGKAEAVAKALRSSQREVAAE